MTTDLLSEMTLPSVLLESVQKPSGIVVMSGMLKSGLPQSLEKVLRSIPDRTMARLEDIKTPSSADVVVFDGHMTGDAVMKLVESSEEGRMVILAQYAPTSLVVLRRILSLGFGEGRKHVVSRLADQLTLFSSQMKMRSLVNGNFEEAREVILVTPAMRAFFRNEDLQSAEELINSGDETSGSVSFNQSLLQLLLRRKIDIKAAFESTKDPAHLDRILKKVGI